MNRVAKVGARLFIFEHNPLNPLTRLAVYRCPFDDDAVLLRSGRTEALLQRAGAKNIRSDFFLLLPTKMRLAGQCETLLGKLPLGAQYLTSAEV